jgi:hypothetical protein
MVLNPEDRSLYIYTILIKFNNVYNNWSLEFYFIALNFENNTVVSGTATVSVFRRKGQLVQ